MKNFADFGINTQGDKKIFEVPKVSIEEILNCTIEILDFEPGITTSFGDGRYIVKIRWDNKECKFFTTATQIKKALDQVPKSEFPFRTIIKQQRFGSGSKNSKTFFFT